MRILFVFILFSRLLLVQANSDSDVISWEQIRKTNLDGMLHGNRRLAKTRVEYSATLSLIFEGAQELNRASSSALAGEAQDYIAANIPSSSMDAFNGVVAVGILKVLVTEQTIVDTSMVQVELQVDGMVIAEEGSLFEGDTFPFKQIVEEAIYARGNEFHHQVKPLFTAVPSTDAIHDPTPNTKLGFMFSMLWMIVVLAIFLIVVKLLGLWEEQGKAPGLPLAAADGNSRRSADSVDDQSIYTLRESAPSVSRSTAVPPTIDENGGNIFNSFMGWSVSAASDGDNDGFDTQSTADNDSERQSKRVEETSSDSKTDVNQQQSDEESSLNNSIATSRRTSNLAISPLEATEQEQEDIDLDDPECKKPHLGEEDMKNFDRYLRNLPTSNMPQKPIAKRERR